MQAFFHAQRLFAASLTAFTPDEHHAAVLDWVDFAQWLWFDAARRMGTL